MARPAEPEPNTKIQIKNRKRRQQFAPLIHSSFVGLGRQGCFELVGLIQDRIIQAGLFYSVWNYPLRCLGKPKDEIFVPVGRLELQRDGQIVGVVPDGHGDAGNSNEISVHDKAHECGRLRQIGFALGFQCWFKPRSRESRAWRHDRIDGCENACHCLHRVVSNALGREKITRRKRPSESDGNLGLVRKLSDLGMVPVVMLGHFGQDRNRVGQVGFVHVGNGNLVDFGP
mmetsp:Transcript_19401/g.39918  ORF Transcript_19401/g.39918 Transcript_19401/m.39918 type:complete len:229 (+) Transcript_19401:1526-2212(+)